MTDPTKANPQDLSYLEAVEELDEILAELSSDVVDVDLLSTQVKRAYALISTCKDRITASRNEIDQILETTEES